MARSHGLSLLGTGDNSGLPSSKHPMSFPENEKDSANRRNRKDWAKAIKSAMSESSRFTFSSRMDIGFGTSRKMFLTLKELYKGVHGFPVSSGGIQAVTLASRNRKLNWSLKDESIWRRPCPMMCLE